MGHRFRVRRVAKWAGLALCVATVLAWLASTPCWGGHFCVLIYNGPWGWWRLCFGAIEFSRFDLPHLPRGVRVQVFDVPAELPWNERFGLIWPSGFNIHGTLSQFVVPLWICFVAAALPSLWMWRRAERHSRVGMCRTCGYNLKGNVSDRCSECGTPIDRRAGEPAAPSQPRE